MKNLYLVLMALSFGCSQAESVSGVYVKHVGSEYTVGEDSVFVTVQAGQLLIERHTGFRRVSNGQVGTKQIKVLHAVFSATSGGNWQDTKTGVLLSLNNDELLLGSAAYQKIK